MNMCMNIEYMYHIVKNNRAVIRSMDLFCVVNYKKKNMCVLSKGVAVNVRLLVTYYKYFYEMKIIHTLCTFALLAFNFIFFRNMKQASKRILSMLLVTLLFTLEDSIWCLERPHAGFFGIVLYPAF